MSVVVPEEVIKHCESHPLCKGCQVPGLCVAPVGDNRFDSWLEERVEVILETVTPK